MAIPQDGYSSSAATRRPPGRYRRTTARRFESLTDIARRIYGRNDLGTVSKLAQKNSNLRKLRAGTVVNLPQIVYPDESRFATQTVGQAPRRTAYSAGDYSNTFNARQRAAARERTSPFLRPAVPRFDWAAYSAANQARQAVPQPPARPAWGPRGPGGIQPPRQAPISGPQRPRFDEEAPPGAQPRPYITGSEQAFAGAQQPPQAAATAGGMQTRYPGGVRTQYQTAYPELLPYGVKAWDTARMLELGELPLYVTQQDIDAGIVSADELLAAGYIQNPDGVWVLPWWEQQQTAGGGGGYGGGGGRGYGGGRAISQGTPIGYPPFQDRKYANEFGLITWSI